MIEINDELRLVLHPGPDSRHWIAQQRYPHTAIYKCDIWKPISPPLTQHQVQLWLTEHGAPAATLSHFQTLA